jgi:hypothetical protein
VVVAAAVVAGVAVAVVVTVAAVVVEVVASLLPTLLLSVATVAGRRFAPASAILELVLSSPGRPFSFFRLA